MRPIGGESRNYPFAICFALVLEAGVCVAWSPRLWPATMAQAGVLLTAMAWVLAAKRISLSRKWIVIALISLWGIFQISVGQTIASWLTTESSLTWFAAGVSFLLAGEVLRSERNRDVFLDIFLWSSTALAAIALLQLYTDPGHVFWFLPAQDDTVGTFHNKNQFAAMLELATPVALYRMGSPQTRWVGAGAGVLLFAAVVASASRAGVLLVMAEFMIASGIAIHKCGLSWKRLGGVVALVVLTLSLATAIGGPERMWEHFQEKEPYALRQRLFVTTLRMAADRPWLGFGLGTWALAYPRYATFDPGVLVNAAHSDWAEWAAEGGFAFAGLIAVLIIWIARPALRSVWGMGVLAVAIHSFVDYPTRKPILALIWFAMAGALGRAEFTNRPWRSAAP